MDSADRGRPWPCESYAAATKPWDRRRRSPGSVAQRKSLSCPGPYDRSPRTNRRGEPGSCEKWFPPSPNTGTHRRHILPPADSPYSLDCDPHSGDTGNRSASARWPGSAHTGHGRRSAREIPLPSGFVSFSTASSFSWPILYRLLFAWSSLIFISLDNRQRSTPNCADQITVRPPCGQPRFQSLELLPQWVRRNALELLDQAVDAELRVYFHQPMPIGRA